MSEDPIRDGLNWYTYCENNPIMFIDPWGLKAGDVFKTEREALEDMYREYYGITNYTEFEIGASLYKITRRAFVIAPDGKGWRTVTDGFSYTDPIIGNPHSVDPRSSKKDIPKSAEGKMYAHIAYIHSHIYGEGFSLGDANFVNSVNVPLYVLTPGGNINVWNIGDKYIANEFNPGTVLSSGNTFNPVSGSYKDYLRDTYGPEMLSHIMKMGNKCGFYDHASGNTRMSQALNDFLDRVKAVNNATKGPKGRNLRSWRNANFTNWYRASKYLGY